MSPRRRPALKPSILPDIPVIWRLHRPVQVRNHIYEDTYSSHRILLAGPGGTQRRARALSPCQSAAHRGKNRHQVPAYAADDQCTSDLGFLAARVCLDRAGVAPEELDAILLATSTPDRIQPATATRVQDPLGASRAFAFDVSSVCSGSVYAIHLADMLIRSGEARRVLVVASELYSRFLDPKDFSTRASLGDGAGAVLLGPAESPQGIVLSRLHSDGSGNHLIQVPALGTVLPHK